MSSIIINGATEGNLKHIDLELPRNRLIVFTGLSGSGKTTLAMDVLFQECQRQYLEAIGMQGIRKPKCESIRGVSPAVLISQTEANKNPRSTVGTSTDIYTDLRMVYEKLGHRRCPNCQEDISAADCKEETEKFDGEFKVFMICSRCAFRMEKLTRTSFSYNTKEGACPACEGLGKKLAIHEEQVVHARLSLEAGAIDFWEHQYRDYQTAAVYQAFKHFGVPARPQTPVEAFTPKQKALLFHGTDSPEAKRLFPDVTAPKTVAAGKFEGVFTTLWRRMAEKGGEAKKYNGYFSEAVCTECGGERLNALSRSVTVQGKRLPELSLQSLEGLHDWIMELQATIGGKAQPLVEVYLLDLNTKLQRIANVGLGYLSLDRQTITLSGGELQRVKLAATLDSELTGVIYILDEPTVGLHPQDTEGVIHMLRKLRDKGNTVIVIEHDPDVMAVADFIVDIGPGAGKHGGTVIGTGTLDSLLDQESSVTGTYLKRMNSLKRVGKNHFRKGKGHRICIEQANRYNLKNIDVSFPAGCLVTVTGVSGSGKSTLVFDVLAEEDSLKRQAGVSGLESFDRVVTIEQSAISKMRRSNVATYSEVYTEIRGIFGNMPEAKAAGLSAKYFSFNTPGGRCENCEGLGYVTSHMLFFQDIEVVCPVCGGKQFSEEVLAVKYQGHSIKDILQLPVEEAGAVFADHRKIMHMLSLLQEVRLGYLELGQTLTTLSGGEGQRLKLAKELITPAGKQTLYLMDEPTSGLHPVDVENFVAMLNRMVDAGNTVIVVEHNQQVIEASDWIIDLGPEGGSKGGEIMFAGTPQELLEQGVSPTAVCLRKAR